MRRARILQALLARLQVITLANGFATDAGQQLFMGAVPNLGPDDPPAAIAIVVQPDVIQAQQNNIKLRLQTDIVVVNRMDPGSAASWNAGWMLVEDMLGDVKRAMELEDRTLGGLLVAGNNSLGLERGTTDPYQREPGSPVMGFLITYICPYVEAWGDPEA